MCGRYATTRSSADLSKLFEAFDETQGGLEADYNVAPTDPVPIVRVSASRDGRALSLARWGLVPPWAADLRAGARMINARAETVATSKVFQSAFAQRRCLVPADGWYEWTRTAQGKQPYYMNRPDLVFGGIWNVRGTGADRLITCSIITMPALGPLTRVHDRMPLMLAPDRWEEWLLATQSEALLTPPADEYLSTVEIRPVGSAVGNVRNDGPELIAAVEEQTLF
ncbi:putative SOS response-associated peptidase YedK [Allocatelliglobosispora scoriae]|uniref:Abasic site processing protein n=1 Tax=Allocatelliglobosispora scoriae TaxID=643052 RepID=A0A841BU96_9ACTN|nr:SOS response-associated peptidase [Allocatelliglobosispora scoriae]MBB5871774.1 putative SOS response-associated peptidase YedK [Allocatelliglobosispora scoriae]